MIKLREWREGKGLTVEELSNLSGVEYKKILQAEKGREVVMTGKDMNKIAWVLEATVADIFFGK